MKETKAEMRKRISKEIVENKSIEDKFWEQNLRERAALEKSKKEAVKKPVKKEKVVKKPKIQKPVSKYNPLETTNKGGRGHKKAIDFSTVPSIEKGDVIIDFTGVKSKTKKIIKRSSGQSPVEHPGYKKRVQANPYSGGVVILSTKNKAIHQVIVHPGDKFTVELDRSTRAKDYKKGQTQLIKYKSPGFTKGLVKTIKNKESFGSYMNKMIGAKSGLVTQKVSQREWAPLRNKKTVILTKKSENIITPMFKRGGKK